MQIYPLFFLFSQKRYLWRRTARTRFSFGLWRIIPKFEHYGIHSRRFHARRRHRPGALSRSRGAATSVPGRPPAARGRLFSMTARPRSLASTRETRSSMSMAGMLPFPPPLSYGVVMRTRRRSGTSTADRSRSRVRSRLGRTARASSSRPAGT